MNNQQFSVIYDSSHYWLKNAHIPVCLLETNFDIPSQTREGLSLVDIEISKGHIIQVIYSSTHLPSLETENIPTVDLKGGQVWPCFVDMHTHLDKGHIWMRSPNSDGSFDGALDAEAKDAKEYWNAEDIYRRMEFGLKCSYAHGTKAIRTHLAHLECFAEQGNISLDVFQTLQKEWEGRLILQPVSLVSADYYLTEAGEKLADKIADIGGILGAFPLMNSDLDNQLERLFSLAKERQLDLDLHTDENGDPNSRVLYKVAEKAIIHQFSGKIICGHCCSLAVQTPEQVTATLKLVKEAGISIVSLPMCNLYLQNRQDNHTPKWRGVTLLHELKKQGISVAVASDNCRDPFFGFGDHDVLEVFNMSVRIAHLDMPYGDWPCAVTKTPADLIGLPNIGRIGVGLPADLILFKGRSFSELLSRPQHDRVVLRNGQVIDRTLPDYCELDSLFE
ncbi:MAG: cytosine deaminase [Okeania sp. SIO2C9]|uniref:cytosine deaminase n=1 Tax=Okeania sp. SIO2C9 TaxID=2607791 RepID=UPI0013BEFC3D|nr:cytosine deaminase [Okeania sp. SIO2C9]NEQ77470.1 cytosine deaminase [Okeania sp. SIO2C9]